MNEKNMILRVADIVFGVRCRYDVLPFLCRDYLCSEEEPEFWLSADDEDILLEQQYSTEPISVSYAESSAILRKLGTKLPSYNAFLLHAAVIEYDGDGYAFSAPSGTGKTTHIRFWQEAFGDGVCIVNGDKPVVRLIDGKVMAFGTPWCGKERYQTNRACELKNVCFIERESTNHILPLSNAEAFSRLLPQIMVYEDGKNNLILFDLLDRFFKTVKFFVLGCTPVKEAAFIAYEGMNGKKGNET